MTDGYSSPYVVSDRSPKQVVSVNLSPYAIGILNDFGSFGLNPSQVVEFLIKNHIDSMKSTEPTEPKVPKVKQPKPSKGKQECTKISAHTKPAFIHSHDTGPITKKVKVKPTKR